MRNPINKAVACCGNKKSTYIYAHQTGFPIDMVAAPMREGRGVVDRKDF
jgi:hypothetical protein